MTAASQHLYYLLWDTVDVVVVVAGRMAETGGTRGLGVGAAMVVAAAGGATTFSVVLVVVVTAVMAVETDPPPLHL